MAGGSFSKSFEHDFETTASPSCSRRNSGDSDASWASSLSSTLKGSNSLLSCSESELSVRTGSTAFKRLPPRPAPPPPPPKPTNPRSTQQKASSPLSVETAAPSFSTRVSTERTSNSIRKKSITSKTLSLKKKPRLSRTLSSEMFTLPQVMSLPAEQMSRTFSSDGLRHILYSLPPAYPPPPPPESPPLPPYAPMLPPTPPTSSTPTLPSTPPPPSSSRSKRRLSPTGHHNISKSSVLTGAFHQYEDSNDHSSCLSNDHSNGRPCRPCLHKKSRLILMSCISFSLSFVCCIFTAYHFMYRTLDPQRLQICLPQSSFKHNSLLEKLIPKDKSQYCATTNDELSNLVQAMFITLKNVSESRTVTPPKFRPVSAHVLVYNQTTDNKETQGLQQLVLSEPANSTTQAHMVHAYNVTVTRDALNISYSGTYFVYSSIYFKPRITTPESQVLPQVWNHAIVLKHASDGLDEALAKTSHSCVNNCGRDIVTTYTGGIFQLRKHDLVGVNVTRTGVDVIDSVGSYLGLVMISGVP